MSARCLLEAAGRDPHIIAVQVHFRPHRRVHIDLIVIRGGVHWLRRAAFRGGRTDLLLRPVLRGLQHQVKGQGLLGHADILGDGMVPLGPGDQLVQAVLQRQRGRGVHPGPVHIQLRLGGAYGEQHHPRLGLRHLQIPDVQDSLLIAADLHALDASAALVGNVHLIASLRHQQQHVLRDPLYDGLPDFNPSAHELLVTLQAQVPMPFLHPDAPYLVADALEAQHVRRVQIHQLHAPALRQIYGVGSQLIGLRADAHLSPGGIDLIPLRLRVRPAVL